MFLFFLAVFLLNLTIKIFSFCPDTSAPESLDFTLLDKGRFIKLRYDYYYTEGAFVVCITIY